MLAREIVFHGEEVGLDHEGKAHQHARNNPADQQGADRDPDGGAVDHHQDRGRDHDSHGRRAGGEAHREALVITALHHRGMEYRAERGGVRRARARHARQQHADDDVDVRQSPAQVADHRHRERDQPFRYAADVHHAAGEEEERQREQREAVDAVEHLLHRHRQRQVGMPDDKQRGEDQRERDRDAERKRQRERREQQKQRVDHSR